MLYWNYYMDNPAKSQRLVVYCCRGWCRPGAGAAVAGMFLYTDQFEINLLHGVQSISGTDAAWLCAGYWSGCAGNQQQPAFTRAGRG